MNTTNHIIKSSYSPEEVQSIVRNIRTDKPDARGATGRVVILNSTEILKISDPCKGKPLELNIQLCRNLRSSKELIEEIPRGLDKETEIANNIITEGIIGTILSKEPINTIVRTKGYYYDPNKRLGYIIEERCYTDARLFIRNNADFLYFLLMIALTLQHLQYTHRFVHYDLHTGNILFDEVSEIDNSFSINDYSYLTKFKWKPKISDFGLSRAEQGDEVILPTFNSIPDKAFGAFNPFYDFYSLLFSIKYNPNNPSWERIRHRFIPLVDKILIYMANGRDILSSIFNYKQPPATNTGWRASTNLLTYLGTRSLRDTINYIYTLLLKEGIIAELGSSSQDNIHSRFTIKALGLPLIQAPFANLVSTNRIRDLNDPLNKTWYRLFDNGISYNLTNFNLFEAIRLDKLSDAVLNYLTSDKVANNIIIHSVIIPAGIKIDNVCCSMDTYEYLSSNKGNNALAISGVYFQVKPDQPRIPIGPYKNQDGYQTDIDLPGLYERDFATVIQDNNGITKMLRTISKDTNKEITEARVAFTCGPILIRNGNIYFTEELAKTKVRNVEIYSCDIDKTGESKKERLLTSSHGLVPNCDNIRPGELGHANNPNPRLAMGILDDGSLVFVQVEGRDKRGSGLSLTNLAELMATFRYNGHRVVDALNLDGGASAIISWRGPDDSSPVNIINPQRKIEYPVGNLLVFHA